jgi:hypothetical protein
MNIATRHDNSIADLTAALQVDVCQAGTPCSKSLESCIGDLPQQTPKTTEGAEISPVVGRTEREHTQANDIVQHKAQTCQSPSSRRANPNKGEHKLSHECLLACDGPAQQVGKTPSKAWKRFVQRCRLSMSRLRVEQLQSRMLKLGTASSQTEFVREPSVTSSGV